MKNVLLIGGLLVGLVLLYIFVLVPLLKPEEKPKDALGNTIDGAANLVTDLLKSPGKILKTVTSAVTDALGVFGGAGGDAAHGGFGSKAFGGKESSIKGGGSATGGYAPRVELTAQQVADAKAAAARNGGDKAFAVISRAGVRSGNFQVL